MEPGQVKQRIMLFAGAGASKAVDSVSYPTTIEFFERLPDEIRSDPQFIFVERFLRQGTDDKIIDVEEVLWGLQTLLDLCRSVQIGKTLVGHALFSNRLANLADGRWTHGNLGEAADQLSYQFSNIISKINAVVYDLYGEAPNLKDIRDNWIKLLKPLFVDEVQLDIFTTNYDIIIETAVESIIGGQSSSYFGLKGGRHKTLDIEKWSSGSEGDSGLLTKLHGSLDWKVKNDRIYAGDPVFTGDHEKQGIIYPGFKGASNRIFFKPFHDYLGRCLSNADLVVFIGFAFRDEYINESIRNNISSDAKVVVLNPDQAAQFPYRRLKAKHLARGFDASTANELVQMATAGRTAAAAPVRRIKLI